MQAVRSSPSVGTLLTRSIVDSRRWQDATREAHHLRVDLDIPCLDLGKITPVELGAPFGDLKVSSAPGSHEQAESEVAHSWPCVQEGAWQRP